MPFVMPHTILLTIDVEDWFQVENFKKSIPYSSWKNCELRVEKNVHRILDLLDSIQLNNPNNRSTAARQHSSMSDFDNSVCDSPKATFFVLGWIAERLPQLVLEIHARGHEVASHGYYHRLCREESTKELKIDLVKSKKLLEDIISTRIHGYRAPGFSISNNILNRIEEAGYFYDSSFNSFEFNKRYGQLEGIGNDRNGMIIQISDTFYELPISNLSVGKHILPWGGGGYFRLFPFRLFKHGVQSILKKRGVYLFYLHPWEIDPEQPSVKDVPFTYRMRHYMNMKSTYSKLMAFIEKFKECKFQTCHQYLSSRLEAY
jgi:polysaccharide deacetylase family protein (PEP-CTERM system associated)